MRIRRGVQSKLNRANARLLSEGHGFSHAVTIHYNNPSAAHESTQEQCIAAPRSRHAHGWHTRNFL